MARTIKTFNRESGNIFRAKYPVTTHFSGLIIPVTNYSLFTGTPPAKMRITVRKLLFQRLLLYNYADSADFARTGGKSIECKESSTSFDGPSVFSISSLNLTIKERNEEGDGAGEGRGGKRRWLVGRELGWGTLTVWLWRGAVSGFRQKGSRPSISCRVVFVRARSCKKEKRKKPSQLYYPSFCFRTIASKLATKQAKLLESIDRYRSGIFLSPVLFFFLPLLPRFPFIEIVYGTSRSSPQVLFYSGVCIGIGRGAICFAERNCAKFNLRIESVFLSIGGAQTVERILWIS